MLLSIGLVVLSALLLAVLFEYLHIPRLVGMLLTGIIFGPYVFDLIDLRILAIGDDLRKIALIVILIRAGLALKIADIKKIGRPALLLAFVPATFEMIAIVIFAPMFFDISLLEALILGSVVAAVSPAIVIPRMLKLMSQGYGRVKRTPHLILAGASLDDVFVLVIFAALIGMYQSQTALQLSTFFNVPIAIIIGGFTGFILGYLSIKLFKKFHMRDTHKVMIISALCILMVATEDLVTKFIPFSGLIAVITYALSIATLYGVLADRLVKKFEKVWIGSEMMLFILVGAIIPIQASLTYGIYALILVGIGLIFRLLATTLPLIKTKLNLKERLFVVGSYTPKATVQAAIGAIPLSLDMPSGTLILTIAVLSIIITAPLGAWFIDVFHPNLLISDL